MLNPKHILKVEPYKSYFIIKVKREIGGWYRFSGCNYFSKELAEDEINRIIDKDPDIFQTL